METPSRPFERYRTRSALFLMVYAVTALIFGIWNIFMVTTTEDRFLVILTTSILVVTRYIGYIYLAGYALLEPERIKTRSLRIAWSIGVIAVVLIANAAFFLYRFNLRNMSVAAVSAGCLITAGVLISHLIASRDRGLTRSRLMRMVSGVLIALGAADMCITHYRISPLIGLVTLFFGVYTERKSLSLAVRQTIAAALGAVGAGIVLYFLRAYLDPALVKYTAVQPPVAIGLGLTVAVAGLGYYFYTRRLYAAEPAGSTWE